MGVGLWDRGSVSLSCVLGPLKFELKNPRFSLRFTWGYHLTSLRDFLTGDSGTGKSQEIDDAGFGAADDCFFSFEKILNL